MIYDKIREYKQHYAVEYLLDIKCGAVSPGGNIYDIEAMRGAIILYNARYVNLRYGGFLDREKPLKTAVKQTHYVYMLRLIADGHIVAKLNLNKKSKLDPTKVKPVLVLKIPDYLVLQKPPRRIDVIREIIRVDIETDYGDIDGLKEYRTQEVRDMNLSEITNTIKKAGRQNVRVSPTPHQNAGVGTTYQIEIADPNWRVILRGMDKELAESIIDKSVTDVLLG